MKLLKNLSRVSGLTLVSRVLGMVRDRCFSQAFGAGSDLDLFLIAFKIPQFLRRIFSEGAFSQAFIPVVKSFEDKSPQAMQSYLNQVFSLMVVAATAVTVLVWLFPGFSISLYAPGLIKNPEKYHTTIWMIRLIFPSVMLIAVGGFLQAALQSRLCFVIPSMVPIVQNILFIMAAVVATGWFTRSIYALVWALLIASCVQVVWLFFHYRQQFPGLRFDLALSSSMRKTLFLMGLGVYATSINQLSVLVDTRLFSHMPGGSLSWFYYAERLSYLPQGLFGVAIATILSPTLVASLNSREPNAFYKKIDWGLTISSLMGLPCAVGLYEFAEVAVKVVYFGSGGKFSVLDVSQTAAAVQVLALGIPAFLWAKVLTSAFYARQQMRWPAVASTLSMVINITVSLAAAPYLQHVAIAWAVVFASYANVLVLWLMFFSGRYLEVFRDHAATAGKIVIASFGIMAVKWVVAPLSQWLTANALWQWGYLSVVLCCAATIYLGLLKFLSMPLENLKA